MHCIHSPSSTSYLSVSNSYFWCRWWCDSPKTFLNSCRDIWVAGRTAPRGPMEISSFCFSTKLRLCRTSFSSLCKELWSVSSAVQPIAVGTVLTHLDSIARPESDKYLLHILKLTCICWYSPAPRTSLAHLNFCFLYLVLTWKSPIRWGNGDAAVENHLYMIPDHVSRDSATAAGCQEADYCAEPSLPIYFENEHGIFQLSPIGVTYVNQESEKRR